MAKAKSRKRFLGMRFSKKRLVILCAVVASLLIAGFVWAKTNDNPPSSITDAIATGDKPYVNLNPPTEQEKQDAENHKKDISNQPSPVPPSTSGSKKAVTPVITNAGRSQVSAFVPGIFEEGGACKATATSGSQSVTSSSIGFQNASYTSCAPIKFTPSLDSGKWSIVVSYSSSAAEGKSQVFVVE